MKEFLIITLAIAAGFPAIIALMSFVMMQNGFRVLGSGYIVRMIIVLEVCAWIVMAIPAGGAA